MRKAIVILLVVALLGIIASYEIPTTKKSSVEATTAPSSQIVVATTPTSTEDNTTATATTQSTTSVSSTMNDGNYTGTTQSNFYDQIQVAIVVSGGKITKITTPVLVGESGRSSEINNNAVPQLTSEALSSQSASIDTISGATYTSQSYIQSLQSAIDQANA